MSTNTSEQTEKQRIAVVKFGGSFATDPETGVIKQDYFEDFFRTFASVLLEHYAKIGLIIGGGPRVRRDQRAAGDISSGAKDRLAKHMMLENAEVLRQLAGSHGLKVASAVPNSPAMAAALARDHTHDVISASWLKEGQSSDTSAVLLLQLFAQELARTTDPKDIELLAMILSNVLFICTADPKLDKNARPISFATFPALIERGVLSKNTDDFRPGMSVPIDPVAVHDLLELEEAGHVPVVYYTDGQQTNFPSINSILKGEPFDENNPRNGTRIRGGVPDHSIIFYKDPANPRQEPAR